MKNVALMAVAVVFTATQGFAATTFTEDFSDNSPDPNLALGVPGGSPTTDFTGDFTVTSGQESRIYLGTNDTDYSTVDFVFEAEFTDPVGANAWAWPFFGMGSADATSPNFYEPAIEHKLGVVVASNSIAPAVFLQDLDAANQNVLSGLPNMSGATSKVRYTWTAATQTALFEIDVLNDGDIDGSLVLDGSDNGFDATNSQLYFGGGYGLTWDNISVVVVPEPSTFALLWLGLASLFLAWFRHRR